MLHPSRSASWFWDRFSGSMRSQTAGTFTSILRLVRLPDMLSILSRKFPRRAFGVAAGAVRPVAPAPRGIQAGADDHAGQDAQAAQPDLFLLVGEAFFLTQSDQLSGSTGVGCRWRSLTPWCILPV